MPIAPLVDVVDTHIPSCEITTLQHEVWDNTVEFASNVSLAFLCGRAKLLEVLCGLRDSLVEELKVDAAGLF